MKAEIYNALVWLNRPTVRTVIIGLVLLFVTFKVSALELIVLDDPDCIYCQRFKNDVGNVYHETPYHDFAPLKYVEYATRLRPRPENWPDWFRDAYEDGRIGHVNGTPVFILYDYVPDEGISREIARIEGYGNAVEFFTHLEHYRQQYDAWKEKHSISN